MDIFQTVTGFVSLDIAIIAGVFLLFLIYAFQSGKGRIISFILSLYVGVLVFMSFPYLDFFTFFSATDLQVTLSHLAIFAVLVFVIHHALNFVTYSEYSVGGGKAFQAIVLALSATVLTFAFVYHTLPISVLHDFSPSIDGYFASQFFFWWLVAPLAGVLLVSRG
jgi:hypothetical protein